MFLQKKLHVTKGKIKPETRYNENCVGERESIKVNRENHKMNVLQWRTLYPDTTIS